MIKIINLSAKLPYNIHSIANMYRPKHELHHREALYNPEFSPKIPAKKPNLRKKILGGQQSAQQGRRPHREMGSKETQFEALSEEQIRSSGIYRLL